jgi:hypothetical protein
MAELSTMEATGVQKLFQKHTPEFIAEVLSISEADVRSYISQYCKGKTVVPKEAKPRKVKEDKALKVAKAKQEKPVRILQQPKRVESSYKTREIKPDEYHTVKIDHKTVILVKHGDDIQAAIDKYHKQREPAPPTPEELKAKHESKMRYEAQLRKEERKAKQRAIKYGKYTRD